MVQPKEFGPAVHEQRAPYRSGVLANIAWLHARVQLAGALTKPGRNTFLEHPLRECANNVRLSTGVFLTKTSGAAHLPPPDNILPVGTPEESDSCSTNTGADRNADFESVDSVLGE